MKLPVGVLGNSPCVQNQFLLLQLQPVLSVCPTEILVPSQEANQASVFKSITSLVPWGWAWKGSLHRGHNAGRRINSQSWQVWDILGTDLNSENKSRELACRDPDSMLSSPSASPRASRWNAQYFPHPACLAPAFKSFLKLHPKPQMPNFRERHACWYGKIEKKSP